AVRAVPAPVHVPAGCRAGLLGRGAAPAVVVPVEVPGRDGDAVVDPADAVVVDAVADLAATRVHGRVAVVAVTVRGDVPGGLAAPLELLVGVAVAVRVAVPVPGLGGHAL